MHTGTPDDLVERIQTDADRFAASDADDPKAMVDAIMTDFEASLDQQSDVSHAFLPAAIGAAQFLLQGAEGNDGHDQRRLLFLRSIVQLLTSRGSLKA